MRTVEFNRQDIQDLYNWGLKCIPASNTLKSQLRRVSGIPFPDFKLYVEEDFSSFDETEREYDGFQCSIIYDSRIQYIIHINHGRITKVDVLSLKIGTLFYEMLTRPSRVSACIR